jgi:transposase
MLTREQARHLYDQGFEAIWLFIQAQQAHNRMMEERVAALEARQGMGSHNSSKPPSSDQHRTKRPTTSQRKSSGKKPGGQDGHKGSRLDMVATPDLVIDHVPTQCGGCGHGLASVLPLDYTRRQVFDLPPLSLQVSEHRAHRVVCPRCRRRNEGSFPDQVQASTQYGVRMQALLVYLSTYQHLPVARSQQLVKDLFGAAPSTGALMQWLAVAGAGLQGWEGTLRNLLLKEPVLHADETGFFIGGKNHWLHVLSSSTATFYQSHAKRGHGAFKDVGMLSLYEGTVVHDGWTAYRSFGPYGHALCNAHHLRELEAVKESGMRWGGQMLKLLVSAKRTVEKAMAAGRPTLTPEEKSSIHRRYDEIVALGKRRVPKPAQRVVERVCKDGSINLHLREGPKSKAGALLYRLDVFRDQVLRFTEDFGVPFDNNQAERDLRMMKLKQKVSGGFRSQDGAAWFCRIRSYISTMRKQQRDVFGALVALMSGQPWPVVLAE